MSLGYVVKPGEHCLGQVTYRVLSNGGLVIAVIYGDKDLADTVAALLNKEATVQPKRRKRS